MRCWALGLQRGHWDLYFKVFYFALRSDFRSKTWSIFESLGLKVFKHAECVCSAFEEFAGRYKGTEERTALIRVLGMLPSSERLCHSVITETTGISQFKTTCNAVFTVEG